MLHFEGDKHFQQSPGALWEKLSDARFLIGCVPDVESIGQAEPGLVVCKLRPGFGFVRGTLDLTMRVVEAQPAASVGLLLNTRGIGTSSSVAVTMALEAAQTGSRLHWNANVQELGGLLKAVPQGLLKAAAQKVIGDAWAGLEAKLREETGPPVAAT